MEKYLKERLLKANESNVNGYKDNWGTIADYLSAEDFHLNGETLSQADIFRLQIAHNELKEQAAKLKPEQAK